MRVLIATHSDRSHFYSMIPLAWALRTAGHEVRVASQPALTDDITQAGLTAVPLGTDHTLHEQLRQMSKEDWSGGFSHGDAAEPPATWEAQGMLYRAFVEFYMKGVNNDSFLDGLIAFAGHFKPDLVIWEPFTFAGPVAARVVGAAHARLLWSPDLFSGMRETFLRLRDEQPADQRVDPLAAWLGPVLARHGLEFTEDTAVGQWTIDPTPESSRPPLGHRIVPVQYVPYNGPAVVPEWLHAPAAKPRVCLTGGLTLREQIGRDPFSVAQLEMFADLDIELVATLKADADGAPPAIPANTRLVDYVPMHALLPTCAAIVHYGGGGTWSTAVRAGVPQLLIARSWDVVYKAKHLKEYGAGLFVDSESQLRDALVRLLAEPSFQESASRLRDEVLSDPTPNELVPILEKLTAEHR
ncbi:activator-dependent family glycosyltransferase [Micromonospora sp. FIMYZ51]|uniref:activator-dependent family glycosyltransferase n=1 Tax=Micromonospora sp. FIMYZ51 TaxID=3051832 RepID=UPI00312023E7